MREGSKISKLADELWAWSLPELEHFRDEVMDKILAAKQSVAEAEGHISKTQDREAALALKEIRAYLEDAEVKLSGPESVVLASYYLHEEGSEWLESKRLNILLDSYERKPANSTSIIDKLIGRGVMILEEGRPNAHKKFQLTPSGRQEAWDTVARVRAEHKEGGFKIVG